VEDEGEEFKNSKIEKNKYDILVNPMIFNLLKLDHYVYDISELNKPGFVFPLIEVIIKRFFDSM